MTPKQWHYHLFTSAATTWIGASTRYVSLPPDRSARALGILMGTFTPFFETCLVKLDQQGWRGIFAGLHLGAAPWPQPPGDARPHDAFFPVLWFSSVLLTAHLQAVTARVSTR